MISSILVNHKEIYNTFSKIGKSFPQNKIIEHDKNNVFDVNLWKHFSKNKITGLLVDEKNGGKKFINGQPISLNLVAESVSTPALSPFHFFQERWWIMDQHEHEDLAFFSSR